MKSVIGIALLGTLLLTQGCSSSQVQSNQVKQQTSLNPENQPSITQRSTPAKLTLPKEVKSTKAVPIAVEIQDKPVASNLNSSQNQMHLVVVSDDLRFFQHEAPTYNGNGRFEIKPDFPAPGSYTVFSHISGSTQLTAQKLTIPGNVPLPTELESFSNTKTLQNTKVTLKLPESRLQARKPVQLTFDLQDTKNNQPVKDLQPYLNKNLNKNSNETARLVIVRSSSPLTKSDYIQTTALKSPTGILSYQSNFPQKGTYKLWLQFNRNGKVNTADFWVNVI
jgi:hypothetical protein